MFYADSFLAKDSKNSIPAQITTDGPAGVSFQPENNNPPVTESMLNTIA
ncbi:Uncharacterised protein [Actinobacillus ureae]|nr:Uncharacterised protein [Actinobacillus ureae]